MAKAGKIRVNMYSESAFTVQAQGVHTAFMENYGSLKQRDDIDIVQNQDRPADLIHVHTIGPYTLWRMLTAHSKKVVSAHVTPDSFVGSLLGAKYWYPLAKAYLRWFYNRADGVLAVSQEVVDELKKMGVTKPVYLVPNTIDTKVFANSPELRQKARQKLGLPEDEFVIMCAGQIQPRKRVDTFVACAQALPDYRFVWVGGMPFKRLGTDYDKMQKLIGEPPANLTFTGIVEREKVVDYYRAADVFFLPSIQETFGLVIVEGAAAGLPVLLRDIAQYRVTFRDYYLPSTDVKFADDIKRLASDRQLYAEYQAKAAKLAALYDSAAGAGRLVEVYQAVLAGRPA